MSYNVDNFTIKEIRDFTLPYDVVADLCDDKPQRKGDTIGFYDFLVEGMQIEGHERRRKIGRRLVVTRLAYFGIRSGHWWEEFVKLLEQSTGYLRARVTWARGESVQILTVQDGTVTAEEV